MYNIDYEKIIIIINIRNSFILYYSVPNINVRSTNSPPVIYTRPISVPIIKPVRPIKTVKPIRIVTPVRISKENKIK